MTTTREAIQKGYASVDGTNSRFLDEEVSFSGKFSANVFSTLRQSFYPFRYPAVILVLLGIFGRLCLLSSANVLGYWADSLCRGDHCKPIPSWVLMVTHSDFLRTLIALVTIGFVLNTIFRVGISRTGSHAVSMLYDEVTLRTSRLPLTFFDVTPVGRIISRFGSDYAAVFRMAGGPLGEFLCLVFDLLVMVLLMMVASPWFVPVIVVIVAMNWWAYLYNNPRLRQERRETSKLRGPAIAHFAETVQGSAPIKVYGKQTVFAQRFKVLVRLFLIQRIRTVIAVNLYSLQMTTITALVFLATGIVGIWLVIEQLVSVGALAVAFTFIMMTSTTIQLFFEWLANLEEALTGIERLDNYLRRPLEPGLKLPAHTVFEVVGQVRENTDVKSHSKANTSSALPVEVQRVSLRYRQDLPLVLHDVDFSVQAGEHFAIIGRTGSGKSSLIQALYYLYPVEQGRISLGGYAADIGQVDDQKVLPLREFRRRIALIPQEPILFRGSLRENLLPSAARSSQEDAAIWHALDQVGVARWVEKLGNSGGKALDYFVEERGSNLSTGERQLLCMARTMLLDASVVVMDEATSSIDPHSEELLMAAIQHVLKDKTRIVIAHRLSTIEDCDRVLWLHEGRIKMLGPPKEVLRVFAGN